MVSGRVTVFLARERINRSLVTADDGFEPGRTQTASRNCGEADIWTIDRDFAGTGVASWSTPNLMRGLAGAARDQA